MTKTEKMIRLLIEAIEQMKGEEITVMDLRGISTFTDFFLIATVRSRAQMQAILRESRNALAKAKLPSPQTDGETSASWVVIDCGDVVAHLFEPSRRSYYNLEGLWGDATQVDAAGFLTA